ncbi:uncharacterized protein [Pyxicephalus adspersus]|uniref:uncharacterized protein n=1 Tax=Pyxicephalus adspersus TaxID=30357 RepID=UPI003B5C5523
MYSVSVRVFPTDVSSSGNPPERCPRPLSSWKTTPDDQEIPHDHQDEGLIAIKVEVIDKEEQNALYGQQIAEKEKGWDLRTVKVEEEEITLGANTDRNNVKRTLRKHEDCSKESKVIIKDSSGGHTFTQKIYPGLHSVQRWSNPLNAEKFAGYGRRIHQNVHPVKKAFECPDCGKCFYKRSEYIKHERVHTGEKPFQCLECGKYYTNRSVLVKHQKLHTGEKPFMCSDCGKCFSQKAHLLRHQMLHTGEKPLTCQDCGKRFSRKSNLIDHQRTHTGEKPFPCPECDKSFTQKSILIRHQRTHQKSIPIHHQRTHQDEKFVICSECGKIFTHNAFLIHQNTHRGEKPFPCYQCGQCFTQKSDLMAHQRYHTAEYPGLS